MYSCPAKPNLFTFSRMEQRLVRAISKKESKRSQHRRQHRLRSASAALPSNPARSRRRHGGKSRIARNLRRPARLLSRLWRRRRQRGSEAASDSDNDDDGGDAIMEDDDNEGAGSRSSTPRYILDKAGIFRWPPIKLEGSGGQGLKTVIYLFLERGEGEGGGGDTYGRAFFLHWERWWRGVYMYYYHVCT